MITISKLIFFDINGTIIERDSRTDEAYTKAANKLLSVENAMKNIDNSARSDMDVFREVLSNHNLKYSEKLWSKFLDLYEEELKKYSNEDIWRINVNSKDFIEKLSETNHKLALITGELSIGSKYKLEKIGVWDYFPFGGFGEDHITRFGIAEAAIKKATNYYKSDFYEIYVIGDTILDIKTARHIGAKIISITTGSNTKEELAKLKPDYLIDTFKEVESLFI